MNSSSPVIDPSLYGFGGQKRSLDNGGKPSLHAHNGSAGWPVYLPHSRCLMHLPAEHVDSRLHNNINPLTNTDALNSK